MYEFFNKPYDLLEGNTFRSIFVFRGSAFALLFLWVFEPYGIYDLTLNQKVLAIGLYISSGLILMTLYFFILQDYIIKKYTVMNTVLWITVSFMIIGMSSYTINSALYNEGRLTIQGFFLFQGKILSINIIPLSLSFLIHYHIILLKRVRLASQVTVELNSRPAKSINSDQIVINSENRHESFYLPINSLLFITSVDNYIDIYYLENGKIEHRLMRYTLSGIQQDNQETSALFRCHKSYIVNRDKIESIGGNASGYRIKLCNHNETIPMSRKWNKEVYMLASA